MLNVIMLDVILLNVVLLNLALLNVVMLNVVLLNVVMLSVLTLSVVAPLLYPQIIDYPNIKLIKGKYYRLFGSTNILSQTQKYVFFFVTKPSER